MNNNSFNIGEWSEPLTALSLITEPQLTIVDHNLNIIDNDTFRVKRIILDASANDLPTEIYYDISNDNVQVRFQGNEEIALQISISTIKKYKDILVKKLSETKTSHGTVTIEEIDKFIDRFSLGHVIKSGSKHKEDIRLLNRDKKKKKEKELSYSIKSSLGNPSTILNSTNHTNFLFEVSNFDNKKKNIVNKIEGSNKIINRMSKVFELGGKVEFIEATSPSFSHNLQMVDSKMPLYLANTLLYFYTHKDKKLIDCFMKSNKFMCKVLAEKKLGDFLSAVSFGFFPSVIWDGNEVVDGGFLLVENDGNILCLDKVYYEKEVRRYLLEQSRLDTPSSSRYGMLDIKNDKGRFYFTLNLQIRFI